MYRFTNPPKAGDKIIKMRYDHPVAVLTITKVTPTGIIRTEEGESFRPMKCFRPMSGFPDFYREVAPYTDMFGKQAAQYQREQEGYLEEEERQKQTINNTKKVCSYCEQGDENKYLLQRRDEAFGDKNALYMDACIWTDDEPRISVGVCLFDYDIMIGRFPISYCPKCGRKLMEG